MKLIKRVQSSSTDFIPLEVNVDTVYVRFNEEKWFIEEDSEPIHIGYIYDEEQYGIREYIEKISKENSILSLTLMDTINGIFEKQIEYDELLMDLANEVMGVV